MNQGRIGFVRKIEKFNNQYVDSLNYILQIHGDIEAKCISLDQMSASTKFSRSIKAIKDSMVRQRVLQRYMRKDIEAIKVNESPYGNYGGKSIDSYTPDIDKFIVELQSPELRRFRETRRLKKDGELRGAIVTNSGVKRKVDNYFKRNWADDGEFIRKRETETPERKDIFEGTRHIKPPIRGVLPPMEKVSSNLDKNKNGEEHKEVIKSTIKEIKMTPYVPRNSRLIHNKTTVKFKNAKGTDYKPSLDNKQKLVLPSLFQKRSLIAKQSSD